MKLNDFAEDLKFSHSAEDNPIWGEIYNKAFPGNLGFTSTRHDIALQKNGIDRRLILWTGKEIFIDEKVRRKNYDDILIEYVSNDLSLTMGWVGKAAFCDYIAYAIIPKSVCFLLPFIQLQSAWENNGSDWILKYGSRKAKNLGYFTLNCPVPVDELYRAIGACLRIPFSGWCNHE